MHSIWLRGIAGVAGLAIAVPDMALVTVSLPSNDGLLALGCVLGVLVVSLLKLFGESQAENAG